MEAIDRNKALGIKRITPLCFIMSEEIDPKEISPVPNSNKSWECHLTTVCKERLELTLKKEKEKWEADSSELCAQLRSKVDVLFEKLKGIFDYGCSVSGKKSGKKSGKMGKSDTSRPCLESFKLEIRRLMEIPDNVEEITRLISEKFTSK